MKEAEVKTEEGRAIGATAPAPPLGARDDKAKTSAASPVPAPGAAAPLAAAPAAKEAAEAREEKPPALAPPPPSVHRFSARSLVSVDVSGRLVVRDREAARLGLGQLVARLGGSQLGRRPDAGAPGVELVEILLPRTAWAEFVGELGRLGQWLPDREVLESSEHVRVVVRLTD